MEDFPGCSAMTTPGWSDLETRTADYMHKKRARTGQALVCAFFLLYA
jgi:hypothetical protein